MMPLLRRLLHQAITVLPPLGIITAVAAQPWFEPAYAFMNPLAAAEASGACCHPASGLVSKIGVLYLAACATVCLFAASCLRPVENGGRIGFLLGAGLLTAWLCLDELFMLRDRVLPQQGVPLAVTLGVCAALTAAYLVLCRRQLPVGNGPMLALSLACFAASVGMTLSGAEGQVPWAADAAKFVAIAAWTGFHIDVASRLVRASRARAFDLRLGSDLDKSIGELDQALEGFRRSQAGHASPRRVPSAAIVGPSARGRGAVAGATTKSAARA